MPLQQVIHELNFSASFHAVQRQLKKHIHKNFEIYGVTSNFSVK